MIHKDCLLVIFQIAPPPSGGNSCLRALKCHGRMKFCGAWAQQAQWILGFCISVTPSTLIVFAGAEKMRPARNRKAPERLASMPEGPQWLSNKTKKTAQQALTVQILSLLCCAAALIW